MMLNDRCPPRQLFVEHRNLALQVIEVPRRDLALARDDRHAAAIGAPGFAEWQVHIQRQRLARGLGGRLEPGAVGRFVEMLREFHRRRIRRVARARAVVQLEQFGAARGTTGTIPIGSSFVVGTVLSSKTRLMPRARRSWCMPGGVFCGNAGVDCEGLRTARGIFRLLARKGRVLRRCGASGRVAERDVACGRVRVPQFRARVRVRDADQGFARSRSVRPNRFTAPYSVTTQCTCPRVVTTPAPGFS